MSIRRIVKCAIRDSAFRRSLFAEMARFLVTGAGATALDFLLFWLLVSFFPASGKACFAISFFTSVTCRFYADKLFTFGDTSRKIGLQAPLYFASCLCTMAVGLGAYGLCVRLGSGPLLAKLISIPFVTASGYVLFKFVVFRVKPAETTPDETHKETRSGLSHESARSKE